jgi:two-component system chemotaxis sensor kinase CheA
MDDLLREFVTETNESLDVVDVELVRFEQEPTNAKILDHIFRLVHTIKGTCGFLNLPRLEALAHAAETVMGKFRAGVPASAEAVTLILVTIDRIKEILDTLEREQREPEGTDRDLIVDLERLTAAIEGKATPVQPAQTVGTIVPQVLERALRPGEDSLDDLERAFRETAADVPKPKATSANSSRSEDAEKLANQSIRVPVETLEQLMTMVSELVLTRNQLLEIVRRQEESDFKAPLQRLSNVTAQLQEGVMKTRMQPIGNAWQKLPRIVRDLGYELEKLIDLEMHGAETELDRQVLDLIKDPLTHMIRNSADHGLETAAERRALGKPERGRIRLSAYQEGGQIIIEIADDGRGLNTERIRAKAISQGLVTAAEIEKLSETQIHKFIFVPGFSTAAQITSISGRGVGMDVVRNNIDQIGGTIDVRSVAGKGVSFTIKIPLTLAIVSALIVEAGGQRFAIPQLSVSELVRLHQGGDHRIELIKDTAVLRLRDRLLPVARLTRLLGLDAADAATDYNGFIAVVEFGSQSFGIIVDSVFHTEEIVVKPMSSKVRSIAMFSGNTILGDGTVIMIIDPNGIVQALGGTVATQLAAAEAAALAQANRAAPKDATTSLLVFRAGSAQPKAVPLGLITRLEEIDARTIELSNGRHMTQYRGQLMPLVTLDDKVRVKGEGAQPLLVFSDGGRSMALVADEIIDIVDERLDIQVAGASPGVVGSAIINGQATEVIDVGHFLPLAFADWFRGKEGYGRSHKPKVLLIDDSPFFLNMLTPVLQAAGYDVTAVARANEGLTLIADGAHFDVVITDIDMPEMDGFALAERLRADPATSNVPIVGLSSVISAEAIERGRQVGFHDYVAKFDRQGLIASLKEQVDAQVAA